MCLPSVKLNPKFNKVNDRSAPQPLVNRVRHTFKQPFKVSLLLGCNRESSIFRFGTSKSGDGFDTREIPSFFGRPRTPKTGLLGAPKITFRNRSKVLEGGSPLKRYLRHSRTVLLGPSLEIRPGLNRPSQKQVEEWGT